MQTPLYVLRDPWLAFLRVLHMTRIPYPVVFVAASVACVCGEYIVVLPISQQSTQNIFQNNPGPVSRDVLAILTIATLQRL
jgi:hypothetical protein